VGFFVNTLVLRTDTGGDPSFIELLERARTTCLEAYAHQELPFERLVEILDPPRAFGRQPLFQTMLVLQNNQPPSLELPGLRASVLEYSARTTKFDLSFSFTEESAAAGQPAGLTGELEYSAELFDQASAERLAARLRRVLEQIAEDPSVPLHRLEILASAERERLVHGFNDTAAAFPEATLVELFEQQVARRPEHIALCFEAHELSYAELEARANQLAWQLIGEGIGPEDIVALCLPRSPEMILAILAILKAGAAYLPLESDYPTERLAFMIEDARPRRILTSARLCASLPEAQHALCLRLDAPAIRQQLDALPVSAPTDAERTTPLRPHHPAYLIYTSGSTGTPKGVAIGQQSIAHYVDLVGRTILGSGATKMPLFTPGVFDLTLTSLFVPLCAGGQIRIIPNQSPEEALVAIFSKEVASTAVKMTPSHIALLAAMPASKTTVETAIVGGEALTMAHLESLKAHCPAIRVFNEYGPTETTIGAIGGYVDGEDIHIGTPYANTRVYVLDAGMQPCPVGVVGELYIAGAGLARGYWGRAGLTAERFVANPFAVEPGERLYRTGDLGAWREDGKLLFHGRADQQVKIRGFRIEPGEIEAALSSQPEIAQVAVIAREDTPGEKRLVAYLVASKPGQIDLEDLRQRLAARLPEYMVPAAFVELDELPLTANGKLDREALPAPQGSGLAAGYVAPRTPEEILLCELVAELLGLQRVGLADNFFHLGGHSLMATRLAAQIRERLARELPIRTIFDTPVLGDLAGALRALPKAGPPLAALARPGELPLSFAQARLWFLHRLEGANPNYNIPVGLRLNGALDAEALERALQDLLVRHESLRTLLVEREGAPEQHILPAEAAPSPLHTLPSAVESFEDELATAAAHRFDLANEIPFRATLWQLGPEEHALLLLLHHSAADGWSIAPLLEDLATAYAARLQGEAPAFTPLPVQYADYTLWQRAWLGSEHEPASPLACQIAYWTEKLAEL
ncbi:MAG: amino acid adenylation domain-containing protein, partial [Rhodospirillales bacterium]|nr:amino acid adenylation domain-containing protein [Rhodospirillales bacterium]